MTTNIFEILDAKIVERRAIYEEAKHKLQRLLTTKKVLVETLGVEAMQTDVGGAYEDAAPAITLEAADRYDGILSRLKKRPTWVRSRPGKLPIQSPVAPPLVLNGSIASS